MATTLRYGWGKKSNNASHVLRLKIKGSKYRADDGSYKLRLTKSTYMGSKENDPSSLKIPYASVSSTDGERSANVPIN